MLASESAFETIDLPDELIEGGSDGTFYIPALLLGMERVLGEMQAEGG